MSEKTPSNRRIKILSLMTVFFTLFSVAFFIFAFHQRHIYKDKYETAAELINSEKYVEAIEILSTIYDYKDSSYKILESKYYIAIQYYENEEYEKANILFNELMDYFDSKLYIAQIEAKLNEPDLSKENAYQDAIAFYESNNYKEALNLFETINDYKNSSEFILECQAKFKRNQNNNLMAAGIRNSIVITKEGTVKTAGENGFKQLNTDDWKNIISVDIYGTLTIGLQENGAAKIAGTYNKQEVYNLAIWNNLIDIAAGEQFVVGLKSDGTVVADGHNGDGQINIDDWKNIIDIDAGSRFTVALTENKELLFSGYTNSQEEDFKEHKDEWKDVINISASGGEKGGRGKGHTVGLKSNGTLVAVGDNTYGQCDFSDTEKWSDIIKVATGDWYTVGLKSNGTVVMTGENSSGCKYIDEDILKSHSDIVDIAAGYGQTLLLTDKGEIIGFGFDDDNKYTDINGYKGAMLPQEW